jgi:hypothetical protein
MRLCAGKRVCDVASAPTHASVTVSIVPDIAGFKFPLQGEIVDMRIQAGWMALEKQFAIEFRATERAIDTALFRASGWCV